VGYLSLIVQLLTIRLQVDFGMVVEVQNNMVEQDRFGVVVAVQQVEEMEPATAEIPCMREKVEHGTSSLMAGLEHFLQVVEQVVERIPRATQAAREQVVV
jgi:hypothetical protein